jgi:mannose-6-phosphate isomerase-like protein (cupin superfamily)
MGDYTVKKIDEMEAVYLGAFKRARAELGVESFGLQVIDMPPNFDGYPEHDHAEDGQEEVYLVLGGRADFVVDGDEVTVAEGQMLKVDAGTKRKLYAGDDGVRVLAIGCTPGAVYERPEDFRSGARV